VHILWDEPKRRTTLATRGLDFAVIEPEFFEVATITPARNGRFRAIGPIAGMVIVVIFVRLGVEAVSVVSMRLASRRERQTYEAEDSADYG
jgi:uncharacterized DUF497 family protein